LKKVLGVLLPFTEDGGSLSVIGCDDNGKVSDEER